MCVYGWGVGREAGLIVERGTYMGYCLAAGQVFNYRLCFDLCLF